MNSKNKKILIIAIIVTIPVFLMLYANYRSNFVRQLQGPIEGTDSVLTVGNKLAVISKNNHIYIWQWDDLKKWPIVAKVQAEVIVPVNNDKIIYNPSSSPEKLVLTDLKADEQLQNLSLPYGSQCKSIKTSFNGKSGIVSIVSKETAIKGLVKLAAFDCDLKILSVVFQKDPKEEDFTLYDCSVTDDANLISGVGKKGTGWIFVKDVKNDKILWEKTFDEYNQFTIVKFSPDGKTLYVAEKVRFIIVFDAITGNVLRTYEQPEYPTPAHQKQNISSIAVSPDGKIFAADTEPARTIWFWDIATGKKINTITASDLTVSDIAFSPDSKYFATGCLVKPEIKIWKVPQSK